MQDLTLETFPPTERLTKPQSLKSAIYKELKTLLVDGHFSFDGVYSASQFAQRMGVSRTPVREAMLQLESEGYLEHAEAKGFRVKPFSEKAIKDLFEMRRILEGHVLFQLAGTISKERLQYLQNCQKKMEASHMAGERIEFMRQDHAFHMGLVEQFDNQWLVSVMDHMRCQMAILGHQIIKEEGRVEEVLLEHLAIIDGLAQKDPTKAQGAALRHLEVTEQNLLQSFIENKEE